MVRTGGGSTQRRVYPATTNGQINGNPPPSTIAAQIVHNATTSHDHQDANPKVPFGDLVREFLQHPSTDEPDPQLVALICVIAEAGLESLFKDDPFAQDQQRQQGVDSVAALSLIVEKKPHLLLSAKASDDEASPRPPLLLWLLPKLLGLLTHTTLRPLHQPAGDLLGLFLRVLLRTPSFWRSGSAFIQLLTSSVRCKFLLIGHINMADSCQIY